MWRFIKGVEPPQAKRSKSSEEIKEQQRAYEITNRKREFQQKWLSQFSWLICKPGSTSASSQAEARMLCSICVKANDKGPFATVGSTNFKVESLKHHELSQTHQDNVCKQKAAEAPVGTSPAEQSIQTLNRANFEKVCTLFRTAHGIAKQGRPYSDFSFICDLDEMKGLNIGLTYRNDKACKQFVHYIAEQQRSVLSSEVDKARFISLISDGATDSSHFEAEILFTRLCHHGTLSTHFTAIKNVGKANAENISGALSNALTDAYGKQWEDKLVGIATDGASVMLGAKGGVVKKMKEMTNRSFIQSVHCSAHRLELAFKDATKELTLWNKTSNLLLGIYLFYKRSSLNRSNLVEAFAMEDVTVLIPSRVGGTRWVGHILRALKNLLTSYGPLVEHLTQLQNPSDPAYNKDSSRKAKNFLRNLENRSLLYFLHFMWDVVTCLATVSAAFQRQHATLGDIYIEVELGKKTLSRFRESAGPKLKLLDPNADMYHGHPLKGNLQSFNAAKDRLIDKLVSSLTNRFEVDAGLSEACCFTNLNLWPPTFHEDFGDDHVARLVEIFHTALESAGLDPWQIEPEWMRLKDTVYRLHPDPSTTTWQTLNRQLAKEDFSNILGLVDLVLTLPASSVDAERGFSAMARVKTDWRSRLKDTQLSDLLVVLLESAEVKAFDPVPAVHLWNSGSTRTRRPGFMEGHALSAKYDEHMSEQHLLQIEERAHLILSEALTVAKEVATYKCPSCSCDDVC